MIDIRFQAIDGVFRSHIPLPNLDCVEFVTDEQSLAGQIPDVYIQYNIGESKFAKRFRTIYNRMYHSGRPWIVVEEAAFRKISKTGLPYYRWSWFSYYNDLGIHYMPNSPSDRWEQIQQENNIEIYPWESRGENILFMMQRPGDTSLAPMEQKYGSYAKFVEYSLHEIRKNTDRPIRVRLHPLRWQQQMEFLQPLLDEINDCVISDNSIRIDTDGVASGGASLYKDFDDAWAVVGANSNSLTESVCYGIPTWTLDPSAMAWPVAHHDLTKINDPVGIDREQWLNNMGYTQWRVDEIERGDTIHHLIKWYPDVIKIRKQHLDWKLIQEKLRFYHNTLNMFLSDERPRPSGKQFKAHMETVARRLEKKKQKNKV
jgi:hypothetical protein